jgi:regulator of RNase E activity RraA
MDPVLDALRRLRTPIVYDAVEQFGLRPREEGYTDQTIRSILPSLGPFVGYAVTGRIMAEEAFAPGNVRVSWQDVWNYVAASRQPSIMVCQDLDQPPGRGCAWGDVSATIFRRLGCQAVVTNGAVRDIREVEAVGFGLFAAGPIVGHANVRFVEVGGPVKVGGLKVSPGDLIHADEHGAVIIPAEIDLPTLLRVAESFLASERGVMDYVRTSTAFSIAELDRRMEAHHAGAEPGSR